MQKMKAAIGGPGDNVGIALMDLEGRILIKPLLDTIKMFWGGVAEAQYQGKWPAQKFNVT